MIPSAMAEHADERSLGWIIGHELSHLRVMDHSPRFWDTVASIFPEFRDARAQLRAHPPELLPTF